MKYDSFYNSDQSWLDKEETKEFNLKGFPFPLNRNEKQGFFYPSLNVECIKNNLIQLIMTEPGERVMMPSYGTGIRSYIFEYRDDTSSDQLRSLIINAISRWEPRIVVHRIDVFNGEESRVISENKYDIASQSFVISIEFSLKDNLDKIENLKFKTNIS